jgi:hypothetical protein
MNSLSPQPPFIWPELRVVQQLCTYEHEPPYGELALRSRSLLGIVSALTGGGSDVLETWLERNPELQARLVVVVYPACGTRQADLHRLLQVIDRASGRLSVHLYPLDWVTDRATNTLCFLLPVSEDAYFVTGPTEDLGCESSGNAHLNFVFRADPALVGAFQHHFNWLWSKSQDLSADGVAILPELVLPEGSEAASRLWLDYVQHCCAPVLPSSPTARVDPRTGEVVLCSEDGREVTPPAQEIGFTKPDVLREQMARLYTKGALVSIDKLGRVPPLDAPLDPRAFGDASELHRGNVKRTVRMRVSIIDTRTLKEIDKRRHGLRTLLTKFTFGLADGMRWMPGSARTLFESELARVNAEGQKLIGDLLKGDACGFVQGKREGLVADINAMHTELGRPGPVTEEVITEVMKSLEERLHRACSANFLPKLSYSAISFGGADTALTSPWGQAFSLLVDLAAFPRKAMTDSYFFRGVTVPEDDLLEAMNVADDALFRDSRTRGLKERCRAELDCLSRIEQADIDSRARCELVWRIISGDPLEAIIETLERYEGEQPVLELALPSEDSVSPPRREGLPA